MSRHSSRSLSATLFGHFRSHNSNFGDHSSAPWCHRQLRYGSIGHTCITSTSFGVLPRQCTSPYITARQLDKQSVRHCHNDFPIKLHHLASQPFKHPQFAYIWPNYASLSEVADFALYLEARHQGTDWSCPSKCSERPHKYFFRHSRPFAAVHSIFRRGDTSFTARPDVASAHLPSARVLASLSVLHN